MTDSAKTTRQSIVPTDPLPGPDPDVPIEPSPNWPAKTTANVVPETVRINSIWSCRDGRRFRVVEIIRTEHAPGGWWVKLDVLPPYRPRQRRVTEANGMNFMSDFYTKEADFG